MITLLYPHACRKPAVGIYSKPGLHSKSVVSFTLAHNKIVNCSCFMCAYRDDIEMRSNAAYGTVESQYEEVSVPDDKLRDGSIYD